MKVGKRKDHSSLGMNKCGKTEGEGKKRSQSCANRCYDGHLCGHACPYQHKLSSLHTKLLV